MANDLLSQSDSLRVSSSAVRAGTVTGTTGRTRCRNSITGSKEARLRVQREDPTWLPGILGPLQMPFLDL